VVVHEALPEIAPRPAPIVDAPVVEPLPAPPVVAAQTPAPRPPRVRRPPPPSDDLASQLDLGDDDEVLSRDFLRSAERR
jgi:hypothetical protein